MSRTTSRRPVVSIRAGRPERRIDEVVGEEPLEIRVGGRPLAVTMRTPVDDIDLVAGFCWTEGLLTSPDESLTIRCCTGKPLPRAWIPADAAPAAADSGSPDADAESAHTDVPSPSRDSAFRDSAAADAPSRDSAYNVVDVTLESDVVAARRALVMSSSCGICGVASIADVRRRGVFDVAGDAVRVESEVLRGLPGRLRAAQRLFHRTGGLHAAGLFDPQGEILVVREDVGRHNAADKIVGWALRNHRLPLSGTILLVSGRASFELVQKAYLAGIPVLAAVSAPSSLAVELAEEVGMTLIGFLRDDGMNVYAGAQRVTGWA